MKGIQTPEDKRYINCTLMYCRGTASGVCIYVVIIIGDDQSK